MKRNIFTPSIRFLIIALIILAVAVPKEYSKLGMTVLILAWLAFTLGQYLWSNKNLWIKKLKQSRSKKTIKTEEVKPEPKPLPEPTDPSNDPNWFSADELNTIMIHISLRITEKLKSVYKDATWEWTISPSLHTILSGTTTRISVTNMDKYTHADITFDRIGRISIEPMTIGSFCSADNSDKKNSNEQPSEPSGVDVKTWYNLVGHSVLERVITELNTKGHSKLTIRENGDIVIYQNKKRILVGSFETFLPQDYWKELAAFLEEDELVVKIANNNIHVSWN